VLAGAYLNPGGGGGSELPLGLDVARVFGRETDEWWELDLLVDGLDGLGVIGGECERTQLAVLDCELWYDLICSCVGGPYSLMSKIVVDESLGRSMCKTVVKGSGNYTNRKIKGEQVA
jgi:hypothetical protein